MKKKLMGLLAAVLAVSMTTSAFAADTGFRKFIDENYGDKSGTFSANDVYLVQKKLDAYVAAGEKTEDYDLKIDVNNDGRFNDGDIALLYQLALRPAETNVSKTIRVTAKGARNVVGVNPLTQGFINRKHLGYVDETSKDDSDVYGTDVYVFNGKGSTLDTIKTDTYTYVNGNAAEVSSMLDKVSFYSAALGKNVGLRTADGWAKLSVALRYVIPLTQEDAELATATKAEADARVQESVDFLGVLGEEDNKARSDAWAAIKNLVVSDRVFDSGNMEELEANSQNIQDAVSDDGKEISDLEITKTAKEVMDIVSSKYSSFTVNYNGATDGKESETIDASNIESSKLITGLIAIKDAYFASPGTTDVGTVANAYGYGPTLTGDENIVVKATNNNSGIETTVNVFLADTLITDAQAQQDAASNAQ